MAAFLFFGMSTDVHPAGELDTGFNGNGKAVFNIESIQISGNFADVAVIGGGKFLVAGRAQIVGDYYGVALIRCNSDGSLDTSFGAGGKVITDLGVTANADSLAVQSDGKIVVIANANAGNYPNIMTAAVRYTPDGMLDTTFGNNGVFFSSVMRVARDVAILTDDKILIAGVSDPPSLGRTQVTKLNANGTLDTTFGSSGITTSTYFSGSDTDKIAIQNDGKIVVSGSNLFTVASGLVHRFNTDGSPDATFGTGGIREIPSPTGTVYPGGLALQPDGKIIFTANTNAPGNNTQLLLTRLNSDGSTDTSFGIILHDLTPVGDLGSDMSLQSDGKILVCGNAGNQAMVARFNSSGALDTGFGTGGVASSSGSHFAAIALQGSNIVAVGGGFNGTFISRIDQSGAIISFRTEPFVGGKHDQARDVAVQTDGKIVAVGVSDSVASVARLLPDGTLDDTFGTGGILALSDRLSEANAVGIQPDGKILLAGTYSENSLIRGSLFVVRLNANGRFDSTFGTGGKVIIPNVFLSFFIGYDLKLQTDGKIVIAGSSLRRVDEGNFDYDMMAARLNADGTRDSGFGNNGVFSYANGTAQAPSVEQVKAISILPNGKIILAGTHLLRLNADSSIDTTFSPTPVPLNFPATDIKLQTDGKMILSGSVSGNFTLARYANASLDATFGAGGIATLDFGGTDVANAVYIEPNNNVLAGGSTLGSNSRKNFALARFKPNGSPDPNFGMGGKVVTDFGGDAEIFRLARQNNGKIVAAGSAKLSLDSDYALARYLSGNATQFDFDGDSKTDISVFRPSAGEWWYQKSSGGNVSFPFGTTSDKPIPADFTGDGKTDVAFWRPSTGEWFVLRSEDNSYFAFHWGSNGDIPAPADYDGDGKADPAVFRPSIATWFILRSSDGGLTSAQFGIAEDKPVVADYDGDGRADIAICRPSNSQWWISRSTAGLTAVQFGQAGDIATPGDYTGDGKTDVAFWRPSTGEWFILRSEDSSYFAFHWGSNGDIPTAGDYDGDGRMDSAVFRPTNSTWFLNTSSNGVQTVGFGTPTDIPLPSVYNRP
ncbi:MAG: FG-GAP-like repeat-containing protein [Pyrinomonadaceae bacterium]